MAIVGESYLLEAEPAARSFRAAGSSVSALKEKGKTASMVFYG